MFADSHICTITFPISGGVPEKCDIVLSTIASVLNTHVAILNHKVPSQCCVAWNVILRRCIDAVVDTTSMDALIKLAMIAKCILRSLDRGKRQS